MNIYCACMLSNRLVKSSSEMLVNLGLWGNDSYILLVVLGGSCIGLF